MQVCTVGFYMFAKHVFWQISD